MQCPDIQHFRSAMFDELKVDPDINDVLMKDEQDTLYIYMSRQEFEWAWVKRNGEALVYSWQTH